MADLPIGAKASPDWSKPVTHGDLVTAMLTVREMLIPMIGTHLATIKGEKEDALSRLQRVFEANVKFDEFCARLLDSKGLP